METCKYCKSKNIVWSDMYGIWCKDCKKSQYPNTKEETENNRKVIKTFFNG